MSDYVPNPANYVMKGAEKIAPKEYPKLDTMTRDELLALCKRCGMVEQALMTKEEVAEAMKVRLAHIALTGDVKDALAAIERWLDREHGKPVQSVQTKNLNVSAVLSENDQAILKRFYGEYKG